MALIKSNTFFPSLMILLALFGVAVGGTVHKVGDSSGWTMMGVNYEAWASSKTFQVGDSLAFEYNNGFHDVTEVTHNDFELCEPSKPLARYQTGSDTIRQKLQILVLPASLGPVAAPVPGPVRSPTTFSSSLSPVNNVPQHQMGPPPTPHSAAATNNLLSTFSFHLIGDSLVFEYNNVFHDVIEVTHNDFELCQPSKPLAINQTGTKTSNPLFPVSMGHVAAPVARPVRSPSTSSSSPSPVSNGTLYQIGPSPAPHRAASISIVWIGLSIFFLLSLLILG
ncbi:hypothetical protein HID58_062558 [Brassica napus]|uniref:Phytocyanin domain-containing protein n=1 Tax=Brassica napus TaxID=3708 RepID=A0ABQ8A2E0_BRANA|nr:hypothetical protein HID58_062558 [Brassica napus]